MQFIRSYRLLPVLLLISFAACNKALEPIPPVSLIIGNEAYATDASAIAVVNSIYSYLSQRDNLAQGTRSVGALTGLTGDELLPYPDVPVTLFYTNALNAEMFTPVYFWYDAYTNIYTCNAGLIAMPSASGMTAPVKKQLMAELKFLRAFFYFYLVNLFGDVPYTSTTDYGINNTLFRTPASQVYAFIVQDLQDAERDLSEDFVDGYVAPVAERIRPTRWAAAALLSRVYLFLHDWSRAEKEATVVLNNSEFMLEADLNDVFLPHSKEAIFQLQPEMDGSNTLDGSMYVLDALGLDKIYRPVALRPAILRVFELNDQRPVKWIGQVALPAAGGSADTLYFPFKYKLRYNAPATTEYLMVLRLAEQYLIRAEAHTQQGHLGQALADLNTVRIRAGLGESAALTQSEILTAIQHERQAELFTEWGHRWMDLNRTEKIDSVMTVIAPDKGAYWDAHCKLFPIPQYEINQNPNLLQNPGY